MTAQRRPGSGRWCGDMLGLPTRRKRGAGIARSWWVRAVCAAAVVGVFASLAAMPGEAAARQPRVTAVVPSGKGLRLRQLDARMLAPVRGGWSREVPVGVAAAVSPSGTRVAFATGRGRVLVLDSA